MLLGRGQQRSKLSSSAAAGSGRCLEPGVGALARCPPGPTRRRVEGGKPLEGCSTCAVWAVPCPRGCASDMKAAPRPPQGHRAPRWMEMQGAAQHTPRPHLLWSWPPPPVPCMLTRAHTHAYVHTQAHTHTVHMHTHGHTHLNMFNAHSHALTLHTHSSVWHSHTRTLICAHTHVICARISHTCTASHAHTDMCSGTWPLPPPAQAQPTHSEANAGAQPQGLPTPNPALRPPPPRPSPESRPTRLSLHFQSRDQAWTPRGPGAGTEDTAPGHGVLVPHTSQEPLARVAGLVGSLWGCQEASSHTSAGVGTGLDLRVRGLRRWALPRPRQPGLTGQVLKAWPSVLPPHPVTVGGSGALGEQGRSQCTGCRRGDMQGCTAGWGPGRPASRSRDRASAPGSGGAAPPVPPPPHA